MYGTSANTRMFISATRAATSALVGLDFTLISSGNTRSALSEGIKIAAAGAYQSMRFSARSPKPGSRLPHFSIQHLEWRSPLQEDSLA